MDTIVEKSPILPHAPSPSRLEEDVLGENPTATLTDQILQRIRSEYLEMPGLRLTVSQAQRLWGLDEATCGQVIQLLVEAKFLYRIGAAHYGRLTED